MSKGRKSACTALCASSSARVSASSFSGSQCTPMLATTMSLGLRRAATMRNTLDTLREGVVRLDGELAVAYVDIASRPAAGCQLARRIGPELACERVEVLPAQRVADEDESAVLQQVHELRQAALADDAYSGRGAARLGRRPRTKRAGGVGVLAHREGRAVLAALGGVSSCASTAWMAETAV
eukprot:2616583-Pleurochrysis_carterae.AAC.2